MLKGSSATAVTVLWVNCYDMRSNGCSYVSQGTETEEGRAPEAVSIR
jgi:hypothetical protein